jgi:hypothetical protein
MNRSKSSATFNPGDVRRFDPVDAVVLDQFAAAALCPLLVAVHGERALHAVAVSRVEADDDADLPHPVRRAAGETVTRDDGQRARRESNPQPSDPYLTPRGYPGVTAGDRC